MLKVNNVEWVSDTKFEGRICVRKLYVVTAHVAYRRKFSAASTVG